MNLVYFCKSMLMEPVFVIISDVDFGSYFLLQDMHV